MRVDQFYKRIPFKRNLQILLKKWGGGEILQKKSYKKKAENLQNLPRILRK